MASGRCGRVPKTFQRKKVPASFSTVVDEDELRVKEIKSGEELEEAKSNGLTLVDFGTPWSAACRFQQPIMRKLAVEFEGKASFAAANIEEDRKMASIFGIRSIPTLIIFINGEEVRRFVGLQSESTLSEALVRLLK